MTNIKNLSLISGLFYILIVAGTFVLLVYLGEMEFYNIEFNGAKHLYPVVPLAVLSAIPLITMPEEIKSPSDLIIWSVYMLMYVPSIVTSPYVISSNGHTLLIISILTFCMIFLGGNLFPQLVVRPRPSVSGNVFWIFILLIGFFIAFTTVLSLDYSPGIPTSTQEIYQLRTAYSATISELSPIQYNIVHRGVFSLNYVVLPTILIYSLITKKKAYLLLSLLGWLCIFIFLGLQAALLIPLMIICLFLILSYFSYVVPFVVIGVLLGAIFSLILYMMGNSWFLHSYRRIIFVPPIAANYYFEFFYMNDKIYLLGNTLGYYPYEQNHLYLVSEQFDPGASATGNPWGVGYARFGIIGIILFTILLKILLTIIDSLSQDIDSNQSILLIAAFTFPITNSGLLTVLTFHGMALIIVVLYLLPWRTYEYKLSD
ncbi:hypothetical protein [Natrialba hulunbeirensis]|uniref:hypothetical protein n=1 Tax=Natrialba hulunbeirensis TaxID=123783 RepID=UPI001268F200|nr:hypothetical protein [Natrialba hulunbeirensis]